MWEEQSAVHSPSNEPLILNTLSSRIARNLSAAGRRLDPISIHRDPAHIPPQTAREAAAVLASMEDPRPAHDRVLDAVVERMLDELTW